MPYNWPGYRPPYVQYTPAQPDAEPLPKPEEWYCNAYVNRPGLATYSVDVDLPALGYPYNRGSFPTKYFSFYFSSSARTPTGNQLADDNFDYTVYSRVVNADAELAAGSFYTYGLPGNLSEATGHVQLEIAKQFPYLGGARSYDDPEPMPIWGYWVDAHLRLEEVGTAKVVKEWSWTWTIYNRYKSDAVEDIHKYTDPLVNLDMNNFAPGMGAAVTNILQYPYYPDTEAMTDNYRSWIWATARSAPSNGVWIENADLDDAPGFWDTTPYQYPNVWVEDESHPDGGYWSNPIENNFQRVVESRRRAITTSGMWKYLPDGKSLGDYGPTNPSTRKVKFQGQTYEYPYFKDSKFLVLEVGFDWRILEIAHWKRRSTPLIPGTIPPKIPLPPNGYYNGFLPYSMFPQYEICAWTNFDTAYSTSHWGTGRLATSLSFDRETTYDYLARPSITEGLFNGDLYATSESELLGMGYSRPYWLEDVGYYSLTYPGFQWFPGFPAPVEPSGYTAAGNSDKVSFREQFVIALPGSFTNGTTEPNIHHDDITAFNFTIITPPTVCAYYRQEDESFYVEQFSHEFSNFDCSVRICDGSHVELLDFGGGGWKIGTVQW